VYTALIANKPGLSVDLDELQLMTDKGHDLVTTPQQRIHKA